MHSPVDILDIYNVDKVDEIRETIKHGDEFDIVDIKGPVPFRNDCNALYFDLFCGSYKGYVYDIFSNMQFISRDDAYLKYIKLLDSIDGTGEVIILMGVLRSCHYSTSGGQVKHLCGKYSWNCFCNTELDGPEATNILFLKQQQKGISLGTDGLDTLSRSRVAVPFESDLYLDISLVVDGHPLQTTMCFSARNVGVSTGYFENLSVTVNWEALYYHSKNKVNEV